MFQCGEFVSKTGHLHEVEDDAHAIDFLSCFQEENFSNQEHISLAGLSSSDESLVDVVKVVVAFLLTSGLNSGISDFISSWFGQCLRDFQRKSGPFNQRSSSNNSLAVNPREASSAGFELVFTYFHLESLILYWLRRFGILCSCCQCTSKRMCCTSRIRIHPLSCQALLSSSY